LGNLGLTVTDELRVPLILPEGRQGYLYRLELQASPGRIASLLKEMDRFVDALRALDEGRTADDPLNGLILDANLSYREVELLRTLRSHLLQIRSNYNMDTVNRVLMANAEVARALFRLFEARFDPKRVGDRAEAIKKCSHETQKALETVKSLFDDEILRAFNNLITCILRTNYYQQPERPVISIKVDSQKVEGMSLPRPMVEVYVRSPLLEGIHLRDGRVARGGIRWSDRHDDFRMETLGLMKTQTLKNVVIVPVGSKGGFVLKGKMPAGSAMDAYLSDRYREYISGLLDITDNIIDGVVLHPPEVVLHDGDDPYLVVAADKGTAHLSDTANGVSSQYGYWLGDAFASGGSAGYDHKKIGITGKGAWECIKHHFRNLGIDIQDQVFTVCGIGDMGGDVFGNAMLCSRAIKLVAAFNGDHLFIDPDPDPARSYEERKRLFHLEHSTWRDYNLAAISPGGGIFDRSAKAIPLTPEIRSLLDIDGATASGEEIVRSVLAARVDLLYDGGIGTYVKSSNESHAQVGDRANDRVRINGVEVRARVVGEGGNLGFTQKARVEYWMRGGVMNTDALDNSGGVDMSDHEVNIKILLDMLVRKGVIGSREERNQILVEMTDEVAAAVLAHNIQQSRALTLDGMRSAAQYEDFVGLIDQMVAGDVIHRAEESVVLREDLLNVKSRDRGLPRPLLAVLLAYNKMWAFARILHTEFPDSAAAGPFIDSYFPKRLRVAFAPFFADHPLRREIAATEAVNYVVNNGGIGLIPRLTKASGSDLHTVVSSYLDLDRRSGLPDLRQHFLNGGLDAVAEHRALLRAEDALETATREALTGGDTGKALGSLKRFVLKAKSVDG
jgi:glutamate dehydrogenase